MTDVDDRFTTNDDDRFMMTDVDDRFTTNDDDRFMMTDDMIGSR
jgi:hypothetical protein